MIISISPRPVPIPPAPKKKAKNPTIHRFSTLELEMPLPVKELLLYTRMEGEASEKAQQRCGEQKISQSAEPASGLWSGTWLALVGPSVRPWEGPCPPGVLIPASEALQLSQPLCPWG